MFVDFAMQMCYGLNIAEQVFVPHTATGAESRLLYNWEVRDIKSRKWGNEKRVQGKNNCVNKRLKMASWVISLYFLYSISRARVGAISLEAIGHGARFLGGDIMHPSYLDTSCCFFHNFHPLSSLSLSHELWLPFLHRPRSPSLGMTYDRHYQDHSQD